MTQRTLIAFLNSARWMWIVLGIITFFAAVALWMGIQFHDAWRVAIGLSGLGFAWFRGSRRLKRVAFDWLQRMLNRHRETTALCDPIDDEPCEPRATRPRSEEPSDLGELIEQMLANGRYALLLRPQIANQLSREQIARAKKALEEDMALVPDGEVLLDRFTDPIEDEADENADNSPGSVVEVQRLFLDRYTVTNRQFARFVDAGGYQQMALWEPEIWPAILDFVDAGGQPGPKFWKNGRYPRGQDDFPVVGVSWYEAAAYARWIGKRLPTDAEWVKAGCWPVVLSPTSRLQRRYPWGESMDRRRANVWCAGRNSVVSVYDFTEGVSVGGVYQLIGNVWEWTSSPFSPDHISDDRIVLGTTMRSLRGGAYDTYFDSHATCQFATGDSPAVRKHNVGFRCGLSACDLALFSPTPRPASINQPQNGANPAADKSTTSTKRPSGEQETPACQETTV